MFSAPSGIASLPFDAVDFLTQHSVRLYPLAAIPTKKRNTFSGLSETLDGPSLVVATPPVLAAAPKWLLYAFEKANADVIFQRWDGGDEHGGPTLLACNWWVSAMGQEANYTPGTRAAYIALSYLSPGWSTAPLPAVANQAFAQVRQMIADKTVWQLVTARGDGSASNVVEFTVPENAANPGSGHRVALYVDPRSATVSAIVDGVTRASLVGAATYPLVEYVAADPVTNDTTYAAAQLVVDGIVSGHDVTVMCALSGVVVANFWTGAPNVTVTYP